MALTMLDHRDPSTRLRAALAAGTAADPDAANALIARCAVEPDFFVRDMLTWALARLPAGTTVPLLRAELASAAPQARSQALHTLSKIGPADAGVAFPEAVALAGDPEDGVATAAWRTVVALAPGPDARRSAARTLATRLGHGGVETRRSLSRALVALGDEGLAALAAVAAPNDAVRAHIADTIRLLDDPDSGFAGSMHEAKRVAALGEHA
ncbi:HEAT repeat domain-containing protein [Tsukamurella sp. PLM1]|uniref:HEAT repeat domain-containing protein n=1 Tax=Tsukamurella sp. PLM1 TaxID=2929795 RepID=UPI002045A9F9|nr:HEAT repeat domain-containing protein [Tsukamurella sp. PLM1]BDH57816.1 hypothetical protein MTP03_27550 [Tsukamurella sp. PLM1]